MDNLKYSDTIPFSKSENYSDSYCFSIVRIGNLESIPGIDNLALTMVEGNTVVVDKSKVKSGDIMFYASNGTVICNDLIDNTGLLYELMNPDVKSLRYGGCIASVSYKASDRKEIVSLGYLISSDYIFQYCPGLKNIDLNKYLGESFDTLCGKRIIKRYFPQACIMASSFTIPYVIPFGDDNRLYQRYKALKPDYKSQSFLKALYGCLIRPDMIFDITKQVNGLSMSIGNIPVEQDNKKWYNPITRFINTKIFGNKPSFYDANDDKEYSYEYIYSSKKYIRNGIKKSFRKCLNRFNGYNSKKDIYYKFYNLFVETDLLNENEIIYGEILGYDGNRKVQEKYDYGCSPEKGHIHSIFVPYRIIRYNKHFDTYTELDLDEINKWIDGKKVKDAIEKMRAKGYSIEKPISLYHGSILSLYPHIDYDKDNWRDEVVKNLYEDKRFGLNEYECAYGNNINNKAYTEGIVFKIYNDIVPRYFKLKSRLFIHQKEEILDSCRSYDNETIESI